MWCCRRLGVYIRRRHSITGRADEEKEEKQDQTIGMEGSNKSFVVDAPPVATWNCNVYGVDFSPDGKLLALGCGGFYGFGGIALVCLESGKIIYMLRFGRRDRGFPGESAPNFLRERNDQSLTISGVAFDASGKYLAATSWYQRHSPGPVFLFSVESNKENDASTSEVTKATLRHCASFSVEGRSRWGAGIPTGICFSNGKLFIRFHGANAADKIISSFSIPEEFPANTNSPFKHRCHARIVAVERNCISNRNGLHTVPASTSLEEEILTGFSSRQGNLESGLVATHSGINANFAFHEGSDQSITAVLALPDVNKDFERKIVSGGRDGAIVLWGSGSHDGMPCVNWRPICHIRTNTKRQASVEGAWSCYKPESVVALCALEDGRFFSADCSGEILEWKFNDVASKWICCQRRMLPRQGTPRCMAVHPRTSRQGGALLAVGVKAGDGPPTSDLIDGRRGFVAFFDISTAWYHVGHFILMRQLLDMGHAELKKFEPGPDEREALIEQLMADTDISIFRTILSFLIPRYSDKHCE